MWLFILFLIFSVLPFLPEAVYSIINNIYVNHHFQLENYNHLPDFLNFKYIKDYLMVLILVLINIDFLVNRKFNSSSIFLIFSLGLILAYGATVSIFIHNQYSIFQFLAGIRPVVLILLCFQILKYINYSNLNSLYRTILFLLYTQFIIITLQYVVFINHFGVVNPMSIRMIGTFGGIANVAYFALIVSVIVLLVHTFNDSIMKIRYNTLNLFICFLVIFFSGTRAALIGVSIIIFIYIFSLGRKKVTKNKQYLTLAVSVSLVFIFFLLVEVASALSGRGSMLVQQASGGRVDFFLSFFRDSTNLEIFFGQGLGVGTNTAVLLDQRLGSLIDTRWMDGTFNVVVMQFGLFALVSFIIIYIFWSVCMLKMSKGNILLASGLIITNTIMSLTMNIFELFAYLPFFFIAVYLFFKPSVIVKSNEYRQTT